MMISYAQNREDVVLDRAFPRGTPGFYIDVGANDPLTGSVTKHFYELGWRGVNVEPARAPYALLCRDRDRDVNLNVGLAGQTGTLTFYEFAGEYSGGSTFISAEAERLRELELYEERQVAVTTLAHVCEENVGDQQIDFLSIDTEGFEREVISGADWDRWRPRIIVVESTRPRTTVSTHESWESILLDAGYLFVAFDGLNRFYVRSEEPQLAGPIAIPANVLDQFVPYEHQKATQSLQMSLRATQRALASSRAIQVSLAAESQERVRALADIRVRCEDAERALGYMRAEHEATLRRIASPKAAVQQAGAPPVAADASVGPMSLKIATEITRASRRFPRGGKAARKMIRRTARLARRLRIRRSP